MKNLHFIYKFIDHTNRSLIKIVYEIYCNSEPNIKWKFNEDGNNAHIQNVTQHIQWMTKLKAKLIRLVIDGYFTGGQAGFNDFKFIKEKAIKIMENVNTTIDEPLPTSTIQRHKHFEKICFKFATIATKNPQVKSDSYNYKKSEYHSFFTIDTMSDDIVLKRLMPENGIIKIQSNTDQLNGSQSNATKSNATQSSRSPINQQLNQQSNQQSNQQLNQQSNQQLNQLIQQSTQLPVQSPQLQQLNQPSNQLQQLQLLQPQPLQQPRQYIPPEYPINYPTINQMTTTRRNIIGKDNNQSNQSNNQSNQSNNLTPNKKQQDVHRVDQTGGENMFYDKYVKYKQKYINEKNNSKKDRML